MSAPDLCDIRHHVEQLAANNPEAFCELLYTLAEDLKGAIFARNRGPFAVAARQAGYALGDVCRTYAMEVDIASAEPELPLMVAAE